MDLAGYRFEKLREDPEHILYRACIPDGAESRLVVAPMSRHAEARMIELFEHECDLSVDMTSDWAALPLRLARHNDRTVLLLADPGSLPLDLVTSAPTPLRRFLDTAIGIAAAVGRMHAAGIVHKDIKPANILVDEIGNAHLFGFGFASRLPRERQALTAPEIIPGSLAYIAPEQTGRINRSTDSRSDLYALGVTLYELLVGALPFSASDPMEWIHCHIARPPPPPSVRVEGIPLGVESIVLKLLQKNSEARYQTAAGLEHDLRRCKAALETHGRIDAFPLAERDWSDQLQIPEALYGRSREAAALADAFQEVAEEGRFRLMLVSGYSGVGKSSVVNELHAVLHQARGLFASGKFDQYKRDIPFQTVAGAFQGLVRQLLTRDEAELARWRDALMLAVGASGQLMIDLVPDLALILGPQSAPPGLAAEEEKNRFFLILCNFIGVFAQPEHPLVLFLDDLQWVDAATLALLERLAVDEGIPNLLLIGAYRTNEVSSWHGLGQTLERIAAATGPIAEIRLAPLEPADIDLLVADTLHADVGAVAELGQLVFQRTEGNPFFAIQFLTALHADHLLVLDPATGAWSWSIEAIRAAPGNANIADLVTARLLGFDEAALTAIRALACLGNSARTGTLARVLGMPETQVDKALLPFIGGDLLDHSGRTYAFAHDGVHEAAYALVPEAERATMHLRIGRLLLGTMTQKDLEDEIFEVVNHFNRGLTLITSPAERQQLAGLNLIAGKRAKAATAYESALAYLGAGCTLLGDEDPARTDRTSFDLRFHRADCLFLLGDIPNSEAQFEALASQCANDSDLVMVVGRQVMLYTYIGRIDRALQLCIGCLADMGLTLPQNPGAAEIEREYQALLDRIGTRDVATLIDMPVMQDARWRDIMGLLGALLGPAGVLNGDLLDLVLLRMVNVSLDHGHADESCQAYANIGGRVLGWRFQNFEAATAFGDLALHLTDLRGIDRYAARIYAIISGIVGPWTMPLRDCYQIAIRAIDIPRERGGITYSGYAWVCGLTALLDSGKSLAEVEKLAETALTFACNAKFSLVIEFIKTQLFLIRALRGKTPDFASLDQQGCVEPDYEAHLAAAPHLLHALTRFRVRKLQHRFLAGQYDECVRISEAIGAGIGKSPVLDQSPVFEIVEACFYSAMGRAGRLAERAGDDRDLLMAELRHGHATLVGWAERCPQNVQCRAVLVGAEIASLDGDELAAQYRFEDAIRFARDHGFVQIEAIANERASRFHAARGFEVIAEAYLGNARACYARWGADAMVQRIDDFRPGLPQAREESAGGGRWRALDIDAIIEMNQTVSREIVLDQVIERLMGTVVAHAGAVRGVLLLSRKGDMEIVAEALTDHSQVSIRLRGSSRLTSGLPRSILNYVMRSREPVIVDDASEAGPYASDPYVIAARPRSILCLPLIKHTRLVGLLYLENNLSSHVFTSDRLAVLQLVASQAAISIENAELFHDLQQTQEHARRTRDELRSSFDMIPALAWRASADGAVEFSNKQWHDYTGISPEDAPRGTWMRAIHPEDREKVTEKWRHLRAFRTSGEFEARMRRFDGEYRRFLFRTSPMQDEAGDIVNWHGTSTDIENLKRAEQAQEALARVSRVTALGELTVSIAHEINQPLMAIVTNAATCTRWLSITPPNIDEARRAAERIIRDGHRAGEVVAGIRALAKKSAPEPAAFDLNGAIQEVLLLTRNELDEQAISVETVLDTDAGLAHGDRVQIQQVILNLILNGVEAMTVQPGQPRFLRVVSKRIERDRIQVDVSDSGTGIDPLIGAQIFDVFVTTKPEGIGIGLAICRSIVESHRGRLWTSPNQPCGTNFHFTIPTSADLVLQ